MVSLTQRIAKVPNATSRITLEVLCNVWSLSRMRGVDPVSILAR
jgi:hypothetical protein